MNRFCIYCFETDARKLSKTHVFPRTIGGRIWTDLCCCNCNSVIGHMIEGLIKDCLFFAFGIDKLRLQPKHEAFRNIKIADAETGDLLWYVGDDLHAKPRVKPDGSVSGTKEFTTERMTKWIQENYPNWLEHFRREMQRGAAVIDIPGERILVNEKCGDRKITLQGRRCFPFDLLAKIAYECMVGFGFPNVNDVCEFYKSTFGVDNKDGRTTRIDVSDAFSKRVQCFSSYILDGRTDFAQIPYKPFHSVEFRVAKSGVAYVMVNFFEVLSFSVSICQGDEHGISHPTLLGKRYAFPIAKQPPFSVEHSEKYEHMRMMEDAAATARWQLYSGGTEGKC